MMNQNNADILNVVYSSDNNYAQHMGASIYSLLKNNQKFIKVCVFVISNGISDENCANLRKIVSLFKNAELTFVLFDEWKKQLKLNMEWDISVSSYARLFIGSMLSKEVNRILYLDCDMIICGSLNKLWNRDLDGMVLGAVQDSVNTDTKSAVGLRAEDPYFNAGMLMIDLDEWRKQKIENKCMDFLEQHEGKVIHHDQGILNGVLKNNWLRVPIVYNMMTIHYIYNQIQIKQYFRDQSEFYSEETVINGKKNPIILHYTPSFTTRPWVQGCCHPLKQLYWESLDKTPWCGAKEQKDSRKWYVKIIEWKYRHLKK